MIDLLPVQLPASRLLYTLLDRGGLNLDSSAVVVLYALAASTNEKSNEVWMDHPTITRRTGLQLTAVKGAIRRLEADRILIPIGYERKGIKRWRLNLPVIDGASDAPEPKRSEAFNAIDYVASLTEPMAGIEPDRVRAIVRFHLEKQRKKFWAAYVISEETLVQHLPKMEEQYRAHEPKTKRPESIGPSRYNDQDWKPKPLSYKVS